ARAPSTLEQLVAAMAARVEEAPQHVVLTTDQEDRVAAHPHRAPTPRHRHVRAAPDADPATAEEHPPLPGQHSLIGVGRGRQHPAAALQAAPDGIEVERRSHGYVLSPLTTRRLYRVRGVEVQRRMGRLVTWPETMRRTLTV